MLAGAYRSGISMRNVLMIGHQALLLHPSELKTLQREFSLRFENYKWGEYADRFLKDCLGAAKIDVLDYSSYEGANILHDLSRPLPDELIGKYDLVIEAGTLEHIFNFPVAIANLMKAMTIGGWLIASTISNNLCGHGFYQFSPELIFRIFTADHGFELSKVFAMEASYPGVELSPAKHVYEVADPATLSCRIGLVTRRPVLLFFDAQKTSDMPIFANSPMQSDYAAAWQSTQKAPSSRVPHWVKSLPHYAPIRAMLLETAPARALQNCLRGRQQLRQFSLGNKRFFRKV
jgi:hypothetical protein